MGVYDSQIALAERLIRERGQAVQLVRQTSQTSIDKPWDAVAPLVVLDPVHAVLLPLSLKDVETAHKMAGAPEIQVGDQKALVAAASTTSPPRVNDKLRIAGIDFSITYCQTLAPNGEQILYTMRVRQ